jgi:hypothetical protein
MQETTSHQPETTSETDPDQDWSLPMDEILARRLPTTHEYRLPPTRRLVLTFLRHPYPIIRRLQAVGNRCEAGFWVSSLPIVPEWTLLLSAVLTLAVTRAALRADRFAREQLLFVRIPLLKHLPIHVHCTRRRGLEIRVFGCLWSNRKGFYRA